MPDKRFIGLVHSVLSSAEAAAGEANSPMTHRLAQQGIRARSPQALRAAERGLALLDMLFDKTLGNLDETERDALQRARASLRRRLAELADHDEADAGDAAPGAPAGSRPADEELN